MEPHDDQRVIIVGDIHGCYDELQTLLKTVKYSNITDIIIGVGDLVAKGPKISEVVNFFKQNKNCYSVMGNHDFACCTSASDKILTDAQIAYLADLPHMLLIRKFNLVIVHAGVNPNCDLLANNSYDVMHMRNILPDGQPTEDPTVGTAWVNLYRGNKKIIFGHDAARGIQKQFNTLGLDTGCVYGKYLTCVIYPGEKLVSVSAQKVPC